MDYEDERFVGVDLMLDANAINARRADPDLNQINDWKERGVVTVMMSKDSNAEARAGNDPRRSAKALDYPYSYIGDTLEAEEALKQDIAAILFPTARTTNEQNDINIIFDAAKQHAILVTNDGGSKRQPGGIIGNRDRLARLGITVMRPHEVVELVREKIAN
jgi:hypothetical protein